MSLRIDLNGIMMSMEITHYQPTDKSNWEDVWCTTNISFKSGFIDYRTDSCCLCACEVDSIRYHLTDLLTGKMKEPTFMSCVEPDLEFNFVPNEKLGPYTEMIVHLWSDGCMTDNSLHLTLECEDCENLLEYLNAVSNGKDNEEEVEKTYRYVKVVYNPDDVKEYSYLDENRIADYDSYVWVPVGRDNKRKIAFVVDFEDYTVDKVPYPLDRVKKILRLATDEEVAKIESDW